MKVKNFAIWIKYDSRSGTHNVSLLTPRAIRFYLPSGGADMQEMFARIAHAAHIVALRAPKPLY